MAILLDTLPALKALGKVRYSVDIDGCVFRLHYRVTAAILFVLAAMVTCTSLLGDPINCEHNKSLNTKVVNTFCWIHGTFTLPRYLKGKRAMHPGVGPSEPGDEEIHHAYYQWVPFVLLLQSILFYVPHWIWKTCEGGKITSLVSSFPTLMSAQDRKDRLNQLVDYLLASIHSHNGYALKYVICEVLNLFNVLMQIWFLNIFLGGSFLTYGWKVLKFTETDQENRVDPMIAVFPRVTKCTFMMFGSSGSVEKHDAMCILALNILNEKIFIFLWFWFVFLMILSVLGIIYRVIVFSVPLVRKNVLMKRAHLRYQFSLDILSSKLYFGDYFLLVTVGKNMETLTFASLLEEFSMKFSHSASITEMNSEMFDPPEKRRPSGGMGFREHIKLLKTKV